MTRMDEEKIQRPTLNVERPGGGPLVAEKTDKIAPEPSVIYYMTLGLTCPPGLEGGMNRGHR